MSKFDKITKPLLSYFKFKLLMIRILPLGFLVGLKVEKLKESSSKISIKESYLLKNPFRSIYFAVLAMAAEMASGILCLTYVKLSEKSISMLVTEMHSKFLKKAKGKIVFKCTDGDLIKETIQNAIQYKTGQTLYTTSKGYDESGDLVAEFQIQWSFKLKSSTLV